MRKGEIIQEERKANGGKKLEEIYIFQCEMAGGQGKGETKE